MKSDDQALGIGRRALGLGLALAPFLSATLASGPAKAQTRGERAAGLLE